MKAKLYILCIFALFVSTAIAPKRKWKKRYPELWKSRLHMILNKKLNKILMKRYSKSSLTFVTDSEYIGGVQGVLKRAGKTPLDMYNILIETLHPGFAELSKEYYKEQRDSSRVTSEFNRFDAKFYKKVGTLTESFSHEIKWDELEYLSSKEEVMCEAAFFYGLIDFERAITCLDAAQCCPLTCKVFSNFVADMYFGEASRPDFGFEGDLETRKWLDDMVKKYKGSRLARTASLMRRFTRNIRGKLDDKLWCNYMRAMMTVHLSAALLVIKPSCPENLYDYLADNRIQNEFVFASKVEDEESAHVFLRTFKLDPNGETATMGIINSGDGIRFHDSKAFDLSELPDTISGERNDVSVDRYIPFVVYDAVPMRDWGPTCTTVDSMDKAYFEHKQRKHKFSGYKKWQYIDDQRAGTCTAMSLWGGLCWFERKSQQKLESFRLGLYLEVLKEASKELGKLRAELMELGDQIFEMVDDDPKLDGLQSKIDENSETEDDFLRFFSVAFNSAIRSIRYLHTDPFEQGLDMTAEMQDYADFYESQ